MCFCDILRRYTGPDRVPLYVDFSVAAWSHICSVWQCILPAACVPHHQTTPSACALGNFSLHYTTVPTFVVESQADKISMLLHAGVNSTIDPPSQSMLPFVKEWQGIMIGELQRVAASLAASNVPFSYFNPACWMHCEFGLNPKIGNTDFLHAFYAFLDVGTNANMRFCWRSICVTRAAGTRAAIQRRLRIPLQSELPEDIGAGVTTATRCKPLLRLP